MNLEEAPSVESRIEKKAVMSPQQFQSFLCSNFFSELQKQNKSRKVTSIYLDDANLSHFWDTMEGVIPRKKKRIRWYDANTKHIFLETKTRQPSGSLKHRESFLFDESLDDPFQAINTSNPSIFEYSDLRPIINISYERSYYFLNQDLRVTIDKNLTFKSSSNLLARAGEETFGETIIEFKFRNSKLFLELMSRLHFSFSRFSKYETGMRTFINI